MSEQDNKFPVLHASKHPHCPRFVKWDCLNNDRALANHSQTLQRLSERGGLSPKEIVANLNDEAWNYTKSKDDSKKAVERIKKIAWSDSQPTYAQLQSSNDELKAYKEAVLSQCAIHHMDEKETPYKTIEAILDLCSDIALDPLVSPQAKKLHDKIKKLEQCSCLQQEDYSWSGMIDAGYAENTINSPSEAAKLTSAGESDFDLEKLIAGRKMRKDSCFDNGTINEIVGLYNKYYAPKIKQLRSSIDELATESKDLSQLASMYLAKSEELEARISDLQIRDDYVSGLEDQALLLEARVKELDRFKHIVLQGWQSDIQEWIDDGESEDSIDRKFAQKIISEAINQSQ